MNVSAAEFLERFECPDTSGITAPCANATQRHGAHYYPQIVLPDGSITSCPAWLSIKCRRFEAKYAEWVDDGRRRGIQDRYLRASLIGSRRTPALDVTATFVNDAARRGRALALLGPPGCGKTWSASAAVHAWPDDRPLYLEVSTFVRDLMRWNRADAGRRAHPLDTAIKASFLALDDLGVGYLKPGGYAQMAIEELLHVRHAAQSPTIVTSNWSARELAQELSTRTYDRLREWADVVELSGPSLRGDGA